MQLEQLLELWDKLAERERMLFLTYGQRLHAGQRRFGPLTPNKRKWGFEAIEEALDAAVYLGALLQDHVEEAYNSAVKAAEEEQGAEDKPRHEDGTLVSW